MVGFSDETARLVREARDRRRPGRIGQSPVPGRLIEDEDFNHAMWRLGLT
jgi:hypothetical protein